MKPAKLPAFLSACAATFLFAVILKTDSVFQIAGRLADSGWALAPLLAVVVSIRLALGAVVVLAVFPLVLRAQRKTRPFRGFLRADQKSVMLGVLSFAAFGLLAAGLALAMGIFEPDLSAVFSWPDLRPDPDIVGLGFFLLALVPGIWEELAFRGWIQSGLRRSFSARAAVLLSALFFALYHLSNLVTQPPAQALPGVIMAFFFGIGWGVMTQRSGSVVPAMIAHYLVDSLGQIFLGVSAADPALSTGFFLLLTLLYPAASLVIARIMYQEKTHNEIPDAVLRYR